MKSIFTWRTKHKKTLCKRRMARSRWINKQMICRKRKKIVTPAKIQLEIIVSSQRCRTLAKCSTAPSALKLFKLFQSLQESLTHEIGPRRTLSRVCSTPFGAGEIPLNSDRPRASHFHYDVFRREQWNVWRNERRFQSHSKFTFLAN